MLGSRPLERAHVRGPLALRNHATHVVEDLRQVQGAVWRGGGGAHPPMLRRGPVCLLAVVAVMSAESRDAIQPYGAAGLAEGVPFRFRETLRRQPTLVLMVEMLPIPAGHFRAYLFDLDGTLVDSMPLHLRSWQAAVREFGGEFPEALFWQWGGIPLTRTVELLNERLGYRLDPGAVVHRKEQLYLSMLDELKPIASVLAHAEAQFGRIPMAIVSGSPRLTIERTLEVLGLGKYFNTLVGMEDYTRGKPDPEPFLVAARRLGVSPGDCLVFEDAEAGFAAAEAAGMALVRVPVPPPIACSCP